MIRFDGYYLEQPIQVHNGKSRDNKWSYLFHAYRFKKDGMVNISVQHKHIEDLINFEEKDFDESKTINKQYSFSDNKMILKSSSKFEKDVFLKVITPDKLSYVEVEGYFHFVPWDKQKDGKANVLKDLLNLLDKSKLKTYYE